MKRWIVSFLNSFVTRTIVMIKRTCRVSVRARCSAWGREAMDRVECGRGRL